MLPVGDRKTTEPSVTNFDPVYRSIFMVDIERYSKRDNLGHLTLRKGLRSVLDNAFEAAGVDCDPAESQDLGDGRLCLIDPHIAKTVLLNDLVRKLAESLSVFNRDRAGHARMRLRVAVHAGEVHIDGTGFPGAAVVIAARLIDATQLRNALAASPSDIALIVSNHIYEEIVKQHYPGIDPGKFVSVVVNAKTFHERAWIATPGHPVPSAAHDDAEPDVADPAPDPMPSNQSSGRNGETARVQFGAGALKGAEFNGPTSIGGHAAGHDVHVHDT
jgi:hypothetical protein